jgi:cold shock CspA family protein
MATVNGTIKRLMSEKGFGFVASAEGSEALSS